MIGDSNLFFLGQEEGMGTVAEVMVMIAEPSYRRRGYAREAVLALMAYAARVPLSSCTHELRRPVDAFVAKISSANEASQTLFTQRLGYTVYKQVPAFDEVHMRRTVRGGARAVEGCTEGERTGSGRAQGSGVLELQQGGVELPALEAEDPTFTAEVESIALRACPFPNPEMGAEVV